MLKRSKTPTDEKERAILISYVDKPLLRDFMKMARRNKVPTDRAVQSALRLWLSKQQKRFEREGTLG